MNQQSNVNFIHGNASHLVDWYPNISVELEKSGVEYLIPYLPRGKHPYSRDWLETLHVAMFKTSKPLIPVDDSLGARNKQRQETVRELDAELITYEGPDHLSEPENAPVVSEERKEFKF
jgi:hypothetical protein